MFDRIVAFEPDPTKYGRLRADLFLNEAATAIEALQLCDQRSRTHFRPVAPLLEA